MSYGHGPASPETTRRNQRRVQERIQEMKRMLDQEAEEECARFQDAQTQESIRSRVQILKLKLEEDAEEFCVRMSTMTAEQQLKQWDGFEAGWRGRVSLLDWSVTKDGGKLHAKAYSVGAKAEVSEGYTGAGFEATLFEVGAEIEGVIGSKLGLSADTEVGVGTTGTTAKLLGTGVKLDDTGVEVTVFGSGVKLGKWASPYHWFK